MSKDAMIAVTKNDYRKMLMRDIEHRHECIKNMPVEISGIQQLVKTERYTISRLSEKIVLLDKKVKLTTDIYVPVDYVLQYGD